MNEQSEMYPDLLARTHSLTDHVGSMVHGESAGDNYRMSIPRLLWQHAVEDGDSIAVLFRRRRFGSARALLRPQLEALARAAWAKLYASDQQLEQFATGRCQLPNIGALMKIFIDSKSGWVVRGVRIPFENIWVNAGDAFHDTAHRGTRAVARIAVANSGRDEHVPSDWLSALYIAGTCAGIAGAALLEDVGCLEKADTVWREIEGFMRHAEALGARGQAQ